MTLGGEGFSFSMTLGGEGFSVSKSLETIAFLTYFEDVAFSLLTRLVVEAFSFSAFRRTFFLCLQSHKVIFTY